MGAMTSQITSLMIVYSIDYSGTDQRKHQKLHVTGHCEGNSPVKRDRRIPRTKVSNAENGSI